MPIQAPQWTEFLNCPVCTNDYNEDPRPPVSLGCGHTICKSCLSNFPRQLCPFDQTEICTALSDLPINHGLLQLVVHNYERPEKVLVSIKEIQENQESFDYTRMCIEDLAQYLLPFSSLSNGLTNGAANGINNGMNSTMTSGGLTRPMQRKLVTLLHCQLVEEEGRCRAVRAARSLGERTVKELILLHQNSQHLSTNLWTAVRNRGCQFLGPAMQEDVLKLILLALEDGNSLSRKVLVLFVVHKLETKFTQASKTSIGHVVQLLYRASCFKITKRSGDSSLLQLHEKFRTYSALRKEHDAQVVQIAMEAGLHISPEQWSALLYGDDDHKSHMQSIIDKLQTPASFSSSIQELFVALQRTQDPAKLQRLRNDLERLADIDPSPEGPPPTWDELQNVTQSLKLVINGLVNFVKNHSSKLKGAMEAQQTQNTKYKTNMCRDILKRASCPRGSQCCFAHTMEELEKYRKKKGVAPPMPPPAGLNRSGSYSPPEGACTPNGLENGMNGSRESPDELVRNGSAGPQVINADPVQMGMQCNGYQNQRLPAHTNTPINQIPVTYLASPMQQMQPVRSMYVNSNEQPVGLYYLPNQTPYLAPNMVLNPNDAHCVQIQPSQQYTPYFSGPQYLQYHHAARRGADDKDRNGSDSDSSESKGFVSRGSTSENIIDDLKLDTGMSSSSLFSGKNDSIWRDANNKVRGSSIGSGLDTSSDYSSETFSPLSNESCGSPQSSVIKGYGNSWNQFDPYQLKEGRESSKHLSLSQLNGSSLPKLNGLSHSSIWSQSRDADLFSDKNLKVRSNPTSDWDQRTRMFYKEWLAKKEEEDKASLRFNYSADTQSSFEEVSSDDLCAGRIQEWNYNDSKIISPPPGLSQQAPIGTPIGSKPAANFNQNGKVRDLLDFSRTRNRCNFPTLPLDDDQDCHHSR